MRRACLCETEKNFPHVALWRPKHLKLVIDILTKCKAKLGPLVTEAEKKDEGL